jgi:Tfp pilus assembly protein PilX
MTDFFRMKVGLSRRRPNRPRPGQAGAATLAVAVIMLLVVSVLVFHSHTAGWLEQRATANQARAKQAHAAAEAGLEAALAVLNADSGTPNRATYLSASTDVAGKFSINATPVALTGSPGTGLAYSVTYSLVSTDVAPTDRFLLTSIGGSDCTDVNTLSSCSGQARVSQVVRLTPILLNPPTAEAAKNTTNASFESFFGAPQATIKALTTPVSGYAAVTSSAPGLVWHHVQALTLPSSADVGTAANPVLLVVEGDLTLSPNVDIFGFVFVTGNLYCVQNCSAKTVTGAVAVAGSTNQLAGNDVEFDNAANGALERLRTTALRFAKVMGTWRDW